jgi:sorbitol-specific phosphotransferase system component IIC
LVVAVLSAALVLPFAVLVVVAFELVVDVVGACAITRLAQSTEPITNSRVFFMMILKLLSLSLQAAFESGQLKDPPTQMIVDRSRMGA